MDEVVERFMRNEVNPYVRSRILDEAESRSAGEAHLTFNLFNVRLNFDAAEATVEDELDPASTDTLPLAEFLSLVRTATSA